MVGKYQPYEVYQKSFAAWSGDVPEHWQPIRLKHVFQDKKKRQNNSLPAGSISFGNVVFKNEDSLASETKAAYQELLSGEFLVNPLNMNFDLISLRTALSSIDVVVSTGYLVLKCADGYDKNFLRWLLQQFDVAHMKTLGAGVRQTIGFTDIGNSFIFEPPLPEQTQIAAFLDHETAKIDSLIAKQQRLIALLEEKRQAVISHAVTKGLNPNAPLRPSGIDWLGEIPAHWDVKPLKYLISRPIIDGPHVTPTQIDDGVPFISAEAVSQGKINFEKKWGYISKRDHKKYSQRYSPERNDLLMVKLGATAGVVAMVETDQDFNIWVPLAAIRPKNTKLAKLIFYALQSSQVKDAFQVLWTYGTQQTLGLGTISDLIIAVPSDCEIGPIVDRIEADLPRFEKLKEESIRSLALLKERRTALISAAVTGKIDVRDWQPPKSVSSQPLAGYEDVVA